MKQELIFNSGRYIIVAVYLAAAFTSILRRRSLGEAAIFAALGFTGLAAANTAGAMAWHLQFMAASHGESAEPLGRTLNFLSFFAQLLAIAGAVLIVVAMFTSRAKRQT